MDVPRSTAKVSGSSRLPLLSLVGSGNEDFCILALNLPLISVVTGPVTNSETLLPHLHMWKGEFRGVQRSCWALWDYSWTSLLFEIL